MRRFKFSVNVEEVHDAFIDLPEQIKTAEEAEEYALEHCNQIEWSENSVIKDVNYFFERSKIEKD